MRHQSKSTDEVVGEVFMSYKEKFEDQIKRIEDFRTIEQLSKVSPKAIREESLNKFRFMYTNLKETLDNIKTNICLYKDKQGEREDEHASTVGIGVSDEDSIRGSRICQEVKVMEHRYRELFIEGSLKRLNKVCRLTDLRHDFQINYDIAGWSEQIVSTVSKRGKSMCCCSNS